MRFSATAIVTTLHSTTRAIQALRRTALAVIFLGCLARPAFAQIDCGKYTVYQTSAGSVCRRIAILPWYAGKRGEWQISPGVGRPPTLIATAAAKLGDWETELRVDAGATDSTVVGYLASFALVYDGIGHNLLLEDRQWGGFIAEGVTGVTLGKRRSYAARIVGSASCQRGTCTQDPQVATGTLVLTFDAPSAAALESASAQAIYKSFAADGSVASQTATPVIFQDQASSVWSSVIMETPLAQQSRAGAIVTMFAVANLSSTPQAVLVKVFSESGSLVTSAKTPVLSAATGYFVAGEVLVGGIHASRLSDLLGIDLPVGPDFHGTLVLEGEAGGKIAPVVVEATGPTITVLSVNPK